MTNGITRRHQVSKPVSLIGGFQRQIKQPNRANSTFMKHMKCRIAKVALIFGRGGRGIEIDTGQRVVGLDKGNPRQGAKYALAH